jgi:hypothetical protein
MAKATKAKRYKLLVEGIDFAHRWTMNQLAAKQNDLSLKQAMGRNQINDKKRNPLFSRIQSLKPLLQGIQGSPRLINPRRAGNQAADQFAIEAKRFGPGLE